ncbi:Proposed peptidoglycan lipid II flippase MurJ [hydrothermal vent metagenome]|uniref:Proposed peptidoglycan lipid II flippase MurJ n=1 Tax=hydrothermal vent metagenome TaxID=652676 RepID=A0A3B1BQL5_9ZZZZ
MKLFSERWLHWSHQSVNHRIFSATLSIGLFTLLGKLVAILKELLTAYQFGTGDKLDAFIIAFLLPAFVINILSGSLRASLIPVLVRIRTQNKIKERREFLSGILFLSLLVLIASVIILALAAPLIIQWFAAGFSDEKLLLSRNLLFLLLPVLIFSTLSAIWGAILNTEEHFVVVAIAPALIHLGAISLLLLAGKQWGIYALASGTITGFIAEFLLLSFAVKRIGLAVFPHWQGLTAPIRNVIQQFMPMAAGMVLMSSTIIVDQGMAAMLDPGSVSSLNYASRIIGLLTGVGAMALGTAVLPHFSRQVANEDWPGILHTFRTYSRLILALTIPFCGILIYFSAPLIELLFQRGAFDAGDTQLVAHVQIFYLLQLPFYIIGIMGAQLLSALSCNQILMKISALNLLINIAGNLILMKYIGLAGIALSTSIVYFVSLFFIAGYIQHFIQHKINQQPTTGSTCN